MGNAPSNVGPCAGALCGDQIGHIIEGHHSALNGTFIVRFNGDVHGQDALMPAALNADLAGRTAAKLRINSA
jgi:hypothetical protein